MIKNAVLILASVLMVPVAVFAEHFDSRTPKSTCTVAVYPGFDSHGRRLVGGGGVVSGSGWA